MLKPKHIVILSSEFPPLPGGIGNHALNLAKHLAQVYTQVTVITDQRGDNDTETAFDKSLAFKVRRIKKTSPRFIMYFKRLFLLIEVLRTADVLMASGKFSLWLGALTSLWTKAKTIAIIHGTEVNFKSLLLRQSIDWALVQFDSVIAVSQYTKSLVEHIPIKHIEVIPNGYDPHDWSNNTSAQRYSEPGPQLITVGRLSERKGQGNVIRHLPMLISDYPKIQYHCVGLPQDIEQYQTQVKKLTLQDQVTFHGVLTNKALEQLYQKMDIAVMLSETTASGDVEGFGIALLEANHFGIPAIGSKDCGIEDAISKGVSGELVHPHSLEEFKSAIKKIKKDRRHYFKGAREWAKQHQWDNRIKAYIKRIES